MKKLIEIRNIGGLSARLIREGKREYVELFVKLESGVYQEKKVAVIRRGKPKKRKRVRK